MENVGKFESNASPGERVDEDLTERAEVLFKEILWKQTSEPEKAFRGILPEVGYLEVVEQVFRVMYARRWFGLRSISLETELVKLTNLVQGIVEEQIKLELMKAANRKVVGKAVQLDVEV